MLKLKRNMLILICLVLIFIFYTISLIAGFISVDNLISYYICFCILLIIITVIYIDEVMKNNVTKYNLLKYSALINVLPDMIFIYSKDGVFLDYQSSNDSKLLYESNYFIGKHISEIMPDKVAKRALYAIEEALETNEVITFEYQLKVHEKLRHFETRMVAHTNLTVLAIVRDITESKKRRMLIEELSFKDQLTKVYNRRYFDDKMAEYNRVNYLPLALVMIDVNGLKLTNDAFGHILGDELLVKVANTLMGFDLGDDSFVARIGGDEFVSVIPNTTEEAVDEYVRSLKIKLNQETVNKIPVSISVGWEIRLALEVSWNEVFIAAEDEMFRMKLTESRSLRHNVISVIMNSLNTKNQRERQHSECVSIISKKIAESMGLSEEVVREIETAGLLHDIGKIGIRQEILEKEGPLTEKEYEEVKKHPESGYQILRSVDSYASFANVVLSHHERIDGSGYPRGLHGDEIPLEARIIMVADAYEAMRANRPYKIGISHEEAISELIKYSGTQFDQEIVRIFIDTFDESAYIILCN